MKRATSIQRNLYFRKHIVGFVYTVSLPATSAAMSFDWSRTGLKDSFNLLQDATMPRQRTTFGRVSIHVVGAYIFARHVAEP